MDSHLVGKGQNSSENSPTSTAGETSLVVRLFMDVVYGRTAVHMPQNEFVTVAVVVEERYCLKCFTDGLWDVWKGCHDGLSFKIGRCRACGKEVTL
jgi:hypothetical protein